MFVYILLNSKIIQWQNNGHTYIGNLNNQPIQLANYNDIIQYIGGTAWKSISKTFSYTNVTSGSIQQIDIPTISSTFCMIYLYMSVDFINGYYSSSISLNTAQGSTQSQIAILYHQSYEDITKNIYSLICLNTMHDSCMVVGSNIVQPNISNILYLIGSGLSSDEGVIIANVFLSLQCYYIA